MASNNVNEMNDANESNDSATSHEEIPTSSLTEEQRETARHFQEIAGGLEFQESCRIMEGHSWNLERAVHTLMGISENPASRASSGMHGNLVGDAWMSGLRNRFDLSGGSTSGAGVGAGTDRHEGDTGPIAGGSGVANAVGEETGATASYYNNHPLPFIDLQPRNQRVIRYSAYRSQSWLEWVVSIVVLPFQFTFRSMWDLFSALFSFIRPDPRRQVTDPVGDVRRYIEHFNRTYGQPTPPFFNGSYSQALQEAKSNLRFLIVYLHGDSHESSDEFCRETLRHPSVLQLLNSGPVFWACNINSPEGYRVSQTLREHTYPFLGIIVLLGPRMSLVGRIEGAMEPGPLVAKLRAIMAENEASLVTAQLERAEREATIHLRREQDRAYEDSLRVDQEKAARRRAAEAEASRKVAEANRLEAAEVARVQAIEQRRAMVRALLPPEPESQEPQDRTVRIVVKLPGGRRMERRFYASDSVKLLYYFVLSQEDSPERFDLELNFPKRTLVCQPGLDDEWEHRGGQISREPSEGDPPSFADLNIGGVMVYVIDKDA